MSIYSDGSIFRTDFLSIPFHCVNWHRATLNQSVSSVHILPPLSAITDTDSIASSNQSILYVLCSHLKDFLKLNPSLHIHEFFMIFSFSISLLELLSPVAHCLYNVFCTLHCWDFHIFLYYKNVLKSFSCWVQALYFHFLDYVLVIL